MDRPFVIVIYRSSSIGDVVLASACLHMLSLLKFEKKIIWLGAEPSLSLISRSYPEVICFNVKAEELSVIKEKILALSPHVNAIINLQKNLRSRIACANLARRFKSKVYNWRGDVLARSQMVWKAKILGRRVPHASLKVGLGNYKYQKMLMPVKKALASAPDAGERSGDRAREDYKPKLNTAFWPGSEAPWLKELRTGKWLAVAPGASYAEKRAPQSLFIDILQRVARQLTNGMHPGLVYLGDESDRTVAAEVMSAAGWPFAQLNLAGKLSLWETTIAVEQCEVLLSNDSSLGHIAEAVEVPVAVLFGPTVEAFGFAPHLDQSRSFSVNLGCRPCSKHGNTPCRYGDRLCFANIQPQSVADYLANVLLSACD